MKKRLLGLILALTCLLLPVLTSCASGEDYVATAKVKPMTITLYGITGESTTEKAILEVQDSLNMYTEGNLSTRVLLRLFTEDEYYEKLDEAIAAAQAYKEAQKNKDKDKVTTDNKDKDNKEEETKPDRFDVVFDEEKGTQVDIFMVRGADKLQEYVGNKIATSVKVAEKSSIIGKYISSRYLALASKGTPTSGGNMDTKATLFGIPCNYVVGDYTYLLVNKEIADNYGYAAQDVDTLDELVNFLDDAAKDYSDYTTLYNAPEIKVETIGTSLIGGIIPSDANAFSAIQLGNLLADSAFVNFHKNLNLFKTKGYITEGDAYSLPEGKKIAAAFVKGNAALPEQYKDEYIVVPYAKPVVEDLGTVFCVSTLAANSARCLEVISALMTNPTYRNTLQYGVENVHYKVNDYTHELEIISDDYSMSYGDTGNMFILEPNTSMSKEMLALAANDWALAKQQYRDAIVNPLTTPLMKFALNYYDETNYVSGGWYKATFDANIAELISKEIETDEFAEKLDAAIAKAKEAAEEKGGKFDEVKFREKYVKDFEKDFSKLYKAVLNGKVANTVESLLKEPAYKNAMNEAIDAAKAEATANGTEFDEEKFKEQYKKDLEADIKKNHTFEYKIGYTADLMEEIAEINEEFLNKFMAYDAESGLTFEEHAAAVAAEYAENKSVKVMIDATCADSIVAQYVAWATAAGIKIAPAA